MENYPDLVQEAGVALEIFSSPFLWDMATMEIVPFYNAELETLVLSQPVGFSGILDNRVTSHSSFAHRPYGSGPDSTWRIGFPTLRSPNNHDIWFSGFSVNIGNAVMAAHCGNPWQPSPSSVNPGPDNVAAGLLTTWPWEGNANTGHGGAPHNQRHARIAAGATGAQIASIPVVRHAPNQEVFDDFWTGGAARVMGASGQRTSNLSTLGIGEEDPDPEGGTVTVEGNPGESIHLPFRFPYAPGTPTGDAGVGGPTQLTFHFKGDPAWFQSTDVEMGKQISIDQLSNHGWTFTLAENIPSDAEVIITPFWAESLAGGHRSTSGTAQDIWFALPWFEWIVRFEDDKKPDVVVHVSELCNLPGVVC